MIRIHLADATREELRHLRRKPMSPKVRDCIEMLTLADAGWPAPRISARGIELDRVRSAAVSRG